MPDHLGANVDPRTIDDLIQQMLMRQQQQQQMPFFQKGMTSDDPNRLPRQHTPAEIYYTSRTRYGNNPDIARDVLKKYTVQMNKTMPDTAQKYNVLSDAATPEEYDQYMERVPGS
jgi:hypothetical protein